jgi:hypothetical protein
MFVGDEYINENYARNYLSNSIKNILNSSAVINQDRYIPFTLAQNETLKLKTIDVDGDDVANHHYNQFNYEDGIILVFRIIYIKIIFSLV